MGGSGSVSGDCVRGILDPFQLQVRANAGRMRLPAVRSLPWMQVLGPSLGLCQVQRHRCRGQMQSNSTDNSDSSSGFEEDEDEDAIAMLLPKVGKYLRQRRRAAATSAADAMAKVLLVREAVLG